MLQILVKGVYSKSKRSLEIDAICGFEINEDEVVCEWATLAMEKIKNRK